MKIRTFRCTLMTAIVVAIALGTPLALAQMNDKVEMREVEIWSDGTRLAGNLFYPKERGANETFPAIVLCHGWGGVKSHLNNTYAPKFASGGFVVLAFDYRGWGDSDSRLVVEGDMPAPDENGMVTVSARAIRELVDPFDQLEDIRNAINYVEGESMVDTDRIGIWGTSFGGGLVVQTAADDARVKCVVAQVGAMDGRMSAARTYEGRGGLAGAHGKEIERSRGEAAPVPQKEDVVEGLRGSPYFDRFARYTPVESADQVTVPILFIDAENEELFDRHEHAEKVYNRVKDRVPSKYHVEPGIPHYGIYQARYKQGSDLALTWFQEHLK